MKKNIVKVKNVGGRGTADGKRLHWLLRVLLVRWSSLRGDPPSFDLRENSGAASISNLFGIFS